jgi:hypothetical protein
LRTIPITSAKHEIAPEAAAHAGDQRTLAGELVRGAKRGAGGIADPLPSEPRQADGEIDGETEHLPEHDESGAQAMGRDRKFPVTPWVAFVQGDHAVQDMPQWMAGKKQLRHRVEATDAKLSESRLGQVAGEGTRTREAEGRIGQVPGEALIKGRDRRQA